MLSSVFEEALAQVHSIFNLPRFSHIEFCVLQDLTAIIGFTSGSTTFPGTSQLIRKINFSNLKFSSNMYRHEKFHSALNIILGLYSIIQFFCYLLLCRFTFMCMFVLYLYSFCKQFCYKQNSSNSDPFNTDSQVYNPLYFLPNGASN